MYKIQISNTIKKESEKRVSREIRFYNQNLQSNLCFSKLKCCKFRGCGEGVDVVSLYLMHFVRVAR